MSTKALKHEIQNITVLTARFSSNNLITGEPASLVDGLINSIFVSPLIFGFTFAITF